MTAVNPRCESGLMRDEEKARDRFKLYEKESGLSGLTRVDQFFKLKFLSIWYCALKKEMKYFFVNY